VKCWSLLSCVFLSLSQPWPLYRRTTHSCACIYVGFFICTGFAQMLVAMELGSIYKVNPTLINSTSLSVKRSILSFLLVLLVINTLNGILPLPIPHSFPLGAVVEWLAVIAVLSYNYTMWKWDWTYMEVTTTANPPQTLPVVAPQSSCCAEEEEEEASLKQ
jgi:hypothetical protein